MGRGAAVLGVLLVSFPDALVAQEAPAQMRLEDVLAAVQQRNPRLRALQAATAAAESRESGASTLPDPMLQLGIMNFGLPDFNADMAMSMAPAVQIMQMVPFPGKLSLKGEIAGLGTEMASAGADEAWWNVRDGASSMFFELYSLDRRLGVMRRTQSLLEDFKQVATAMYGAGTGRQADVLRADVEVARMDGDIQRMEAMRSTVAARLNSLMDVPAAAPVASPVLGDLPLEVPSREALLAWAQETRPLLAQGRLGLAQAGKRRDLAQRQIWPDFTVGVSYGQRDRGSGTERMGSAMVGFSIPLHAGSRQYAARDEAAALERLAQAQLGSLEAGIDARVGQLLAELNSARSLTELYRDEVIPQARANAESAYASYRVGSVDFMTLVDAQMMVNRYEGELFQLLGEYGRAIAALESTVGRPLPRTGMLLSEER
jgi:outer membrane protein TolC